MKSARRAQPILISTANPFELRVVPRTTAEDIPDLYEFSPGVGLDHVPVLHLTDEQLSRLPLDRPTRRLLALVDGEASFAMILKVSDIPVLDALTACRRLLKCGILEARI